MPEDHRSYAMQSYLLQTPDVGPALTGFYTGMIAIPLQTPIMRNSQQQRHLPASLPTIKTVCFVFCIPLVSLCSTSSGKVANQNPPIIRSTELINCASSEQYWKIFILKCWSFKRFKNICLKNEDIQIRPSSLVNNRDDLAIRWRGVEAEYK